MAKEKEIEGRYDGTLHRSEELRGSFAETRRAYDEAVAAGYPRRLTRVPSGAVVDEIPAEIARELRDIGPAPNDPLKSATHQPQYPEGYSF